MKRKSGRFPSRRLIVEKLEDRFLLATTPPAFIFSISAGVHETAGFSDQVVQRKSFTEDGSAQLSEGASWDSGDTPFILDLSPWGAWENNMRAEFTATAGDTSATVSLAQEMSYDAKVRARNEYPHVPFFFSTWRSAVNIDILVRGTPVGEPPQPQAIPVAWEFTVNDTSNVYFNSFGASSGPFGPSVSLVNSHLSDSVGPFHANWLSRVYQGHNYFLAASISSGLGGIAGCTCFLEPEGNHWSESGVRDFSLTVKRLDAVPPPRIVSVEAIPAFGGLLPEDGTNPDGSPKEGLRNVATAGQELRLVVVIDDTSKTIDYPTFSIKSGDFWEIENVWVELSFPNIASISEAIPRSLSRYRVRLDAFTRRPNDGFLVFEKTIVPRLPFFSAGFPVSVIERANYGVDQTIYAEATFFHKTLGLWDDDRADGTPFPLYFDKFGDDNGNSIPNWFELWKSHLATSHGIPPDVYYAGFWYESLFGKKAPIGITHDFAGLNWIYLGDAAAQYQAYLSLPLVLKDYETRASGIDLVEITLSHELVHRYIAIGEASKDFGQLDSDTDGIPNELELKLNQVFGLIGSSDATCSSSDGKFFNPNCSHSFASNYAGQATQNYMDDQEVLGRLVSAKPGPIKMIPKLYSFIFSDRADFPYPQRDWANPGKKTNPEYYWDLSEIDDGYLDEFGTAAEIVGIAKELPIDTNNDGLFDALRLITNVTVASPGYYFVGGTLIDTKDKIYSYGAQHFLEVGIHEINLDFPGVKIFEQRGDGRFEIRELMVLGNLFSHIYTEPYKTAQYDTTLFAPTGTVYFTGDVVVDKSGVSEISNEPGIEFILQVGNRNSLPTEVVSRGYFYTETGLLLAIAETTQVVTSEGGAISLNFDALDLGMSRYRGPVELRYVTLQDLNGTHLDYLPMAYKMDEFDYEIFVQTPFTVQLESASFSINQNSNQIGSHLSASVIMSTLAAGDYRFVATLQDLEGKGAGFAETQVFVSDGGQLLNFEFSNEPVVSRRLDGPYWISRISVYDEEFRLIDSVVLPVLSEEFFWGEFTDDDVRPVSTVLSMPEIVREKRFMLNLYGDDGAVGTGVRNFDVYFSEADSGFQKLTNTAQTSMEFVGSYGKTYRFYSIATDNARNVELKDAEAELTVQIVSPWLNLNNRHDVNGNGRVSAIDALLVINFLNSNRPRDLTDADVELAPFYDVTGDGRVSAMDALLVINHLNRRGAVAGEGEIQFSTTVTQEGSHEAVTINVDAQKHASPPLVSKEHEFRSTTETSQSSRLRRYQPLVLLDLTLLQATRGADLTSSGMGSICDQLQVDESSCDEVDELVLKSRVGIE